MSQRTALGDVVLVSCVAGVSFLNSFFSGALTASLPTIQRELGISSSNLQWSVSLYALVLGAFLLPAGRLADVYTHRLLFLIGTALFALFSILVAISPDWIAFTSFCTLLGLGAACNTPAGVGVLGAHFDAGEAKNRAFATLGAGQPLGFISGLVMGALLTDTKPGWRASFYVQGGLSVLFVILGYFTVPATFAIPHPNGFEIPLDALASDGTTLTTVPSRTQSININPSDNKRVDWIGILLSVSGLVIFTFALSDAQSEPRGWRTPFLPPLIPVSVAILAGFFYWESRLDQRMSNFKASGSSGDPPAPPLLSPKIWRAPYMPTILAIVFAAWSGFNTSSYYINLIIQLVLKATPIKTALYFLPMIVCGTALNVIPGFLLGRVKGNIIIITSLALSMVGPILIACIDPKAPYTHFLLWIMIFLPAPDLCYAIAAVQISRSVARSEQATAGALFSVITRLATSTSLAILSTVSNSISATYLAHHPLDSFLQPNTLESPEVLLAGYRIGGGWGCVACAAVGFVLSVVGLRGMGVVGRKDDDAEEIASTVEDDARLTRRRTGATRRDSDSTTT